MKKPVELIASPSPNHDARDRAIDMVVLHYTGMPSGEEALARLTSEASKVSAHYLVMEDGAIHAMVDEDRRAWHAGVSSWRGDTQTNARSIGIEIVNPGHEWGYRAFPAAQIDAVIALLADIVSRRNIAPALVVGHADVAPARKEDPGELFPWARLAAEGLAIGVYEGGARTSLDYTAALDAINEIGYDAPFGRHAAGVLAFQRRFVPGELGQGLNPTTRAAAEWARAKVRQSIPKNK